MSEAYENSYKLLVGETTYDELGAEGPFLHPIVTGKQTH